MKTGGDMAESTFGTSRLATESEFASCSSSAPKTNGERQAIDSQAAGVST